MPKIVDHEERKTIIAKATWNVIARDGLEGATVRSIAKEANLSLGAIQYYFKTHEELIQFAMHLVENQVNERIYEHTLQPLAPKEMIVNILMEIVPSKENNLIEMQVWLEFVSYKLRKKELKEDGVKQGIERIMHHLQDSQLLKDGLQLEEETIHFHAFIDGLALHILMGFVPIDSERIRYLIERELDKLFK